MGPGALGQSGSGLLLFPLRTPARLQQQKLRKQIGAGAGTAFAELRKQEPVVLPEPPGAAGTPARRHRLKPRAPFRAARNEVPPVKHELRLVGGKPAVAAAGTQQQPLPRRKPERPPGLEHLKFPGIDIDQFIAVDDPGAVPPAAARHEPPGIQHPHRLHSSSPSGCRLDHAI